VHILFQGVWPRSYDLIVCAQYPPQWIECDIRHLDFSILGKFDVIMADPPWDIHMNVRKQC
jgi:hypothetical protein